MRSGPAIWAWSLAFWEEARARVQAWVSGFKLGFKVLP